MIPENEISQKAGVKLDRTNGPYVNEYLETTVGGIFAAGNVLQVHDLVDWVTLESEKAGKNAADYIKGLERSPKLMKPIITIPGNNVGYILPQHLEYLSEEKIIQFSFRPRFPDKDVLIEFVSNDKVVYKRKVKHVIPSEMLNIKVKLNPAEIKNDILIRISKTNIKSEDK